MAEVNAGNPSSADPWPEDLLAAAVRLRNKGMFEERLSYCFDKANATFFDKANTTKLPSGVTFLAAGYHYISLTLDDWFRIVCFDGTKNNGGGAKEDILSSLHAHAALPFIHERTFKHGELPQEANLSTHPLFIKPLVVHWTNNSSVEERCVFTRANVFTRDNARTLQKMILNIGKNSDKHSYHHYVSTTPVRRPISEYLGDCLGSELPKDEKQILQKIQHLLRKHLKTVNAEDLDKWEAFKLFTMTNFYTIFVASESSKHLVSATFPVRIRVGKERNNVRESTLASLRRFQELWTERRLGLGAVLALFEMTPANEALCCVNKRLGVTNYGAVRPQGYFCKFHEHIQAIYYNIAALELAAAAGASFAFGANAENYIRRSVWLTSVSSP